MSFPNIPENISPIINLPQDQIINLLLASIAFEELGLAHIINAEAEKIQSVLGTLEGQNGPYNPSTDDLVRVDRLVERIMRDVIKKEMLLQFKLEDIIDFISPQVPGRCDCNLLTTFGGEFDYVYGQVQNRDDFYYGEYAILFADVCGDCQNPANSIIDYSIQSSSDLSIVYNFTADPATITVQCPEEGKIVVSGSGTAINNSLFVSKATFVLTAVDNTPNNIPDTFRIVINAENNVLDHDSGIVPLSFLNSGEIEVAACSSLAAAEKHSLVDKAKLQEKKAKIRERVAKMKK